MQSKIYIAVTGCKRGFQMLYTTPGLDTSYPGLTQSLCDMRKYLRVSKPGIDYFGLDFINGFRVCSIYRSTIDSAGSSGGFISVSLVIPDRVSVTSTRAILSTLLETYYSVHYNRQFGTPLQNTLEDGRPLEELLANHSADFAVMPLQYSTGVSNFNAPPAYVASCSEAIVDEIFASPYHKAYLAPSKLVMLSAAILSQPQAYGVVFNTPLQVINAIPGVSDRLIGQMGAINQPGCAITSFILNGTDYTSNYHSICLAPADRIAFSVTLPNGKTAKYDGTVSQALSSKILVSMRNMYAFNFFPYEVAISVNGMMKGIPRDNIFMPAVVTPKDVMRLTVNTNGEGFIKVTAPFNTAALAIVAADGKRIMVNPNFLNANGDMSAVYPINLRALSLKLPYQPKETGTIMIGNVHFPISLAAGSPTLLIPAELQTPMSLCIGKNTWHIDPFTGACSVSSSKKSFPTWIWGAVGGVAALVACGFIFFPFGKEAEDNGQAVQQITNEQPVQTEEEQLEWDDIPGNQGQNPGQITPPPRPPRGQYGDNGSPIPGGPTVNPGKPVKQAQPGKPAQPGQTVNPGAKPGQTVQPSAKRGSKQDNNGQSVPSGSQNIKNSTPSKGATTNKTTNTSSKSSTTSTKNESKTNGEPTTGEVTKASLNNNEIPSAPKPPVEKEASSPDPKKIIPTKPNTGGN